MRRRLVSSLLVAVLLVAGCGAEPGDAASTPTPPATAPPTTIAPTPTGTAGSFNPTDIAWLQLTAAMAERLLPVLDLVPARTTDPAWRRLAAQVAATQRADLDRAHRLLAEAGAPTTNPHEGHDMPGMVTAEQVAALRSVSGAPLHRLLAGHLRAHLAQSVRVATAEQQSGVQPATVALAAAVARNGTAHLARLDGLDRPPSTRPAGGGQWERSGQVAAGHRDESGWRVSGGVAGGEVDDTSQPCLPPMSLTRSSLACLPVGTSQSPLARGGHVARVPEVLQELLVHATGGRIDNEATALPSASGS
ncbi:DUF305 domain-containing protein [Micromonospora sp. NPDC050276]|uniref:DUF305 domain-containing protein n=1 Tax=Micromonospora sp. NPDC050276 TaxID=3364278 RepID=UPI0037AC053E